MNPSLFTGGLLVAVLVATGGALFLMEPRAGAPPDPPDIAFDEEAARDQVRVESVPHGVQWNEIQVELSLEGGVRVDGGDWTKVHGMVFTTVEVDGPVATGDSLQVCREAPGELEEEVGLTLRHAPSGEMLGSWALQGVEPCGSWESVPDEATTEGEASHEEAPEDQASGDAAREGEGSEAGSAYPSVS